MNWIKTIDTEPELGRVYLVYFPKHKDKLKICYYTILLDDPKSSYGIKIRTAIFKRWMNSETFNHLEVEDTLYLEIPNLPEEF